ncbi:uncharacterized protein JN550_003758 [Neoarthrinium moseri]|uniref:uncharacterized protein n=1 Tax=Neoarthrinium moseri TaxID=1658444 RepID=UPI001FDBAD2E|nr:uncharacterized protein JN550_003758 [Neoarthrinium moseri]KAI1872884.1 hypothetical protein JN550_003758 [Neoarthrinium moseri]
MSSNDPHATRAAEAGAAAALQQFVTEDFTLFSIGVAFVMVRTYARIRLVGFRRLQADDYLVWLGMIFYAAETSLAYSVGAKAKGLANNGMTDEQRLALDPGSPEYQLRVIGSKIQLAGWSTYSALLWTMKTCLLVFYIRLTAGLDRTYLIRVYIGFGIVIATYIAATMTLFLSCRPFSNYWQINPDPGNVCQPAISTTIVWIYCSMNVISDLYLLSIPVPMLWQSTLKPAKKVGLIILFSGGIFVIACAFLRAVLIVMDPVDGAQVAGSWAVRETFVAVITTNLPIVFPFFRTLLMPFLGSLARSMRSSSAHLSDDKKPRTDFRTFGGGGSGQSWRGRGPRTANPITDFTFNESEERMLSQGNVKMQNLEPVEHENPHSKPGTSNGDANDVNGSRDDEVPTGAILTDSKRHQG